MVLDADTKEPIIGATVSDARKDKALTVTNADGQFVIPKNKNIKQRMAQKILASKRCIEVTMLSE